MNSYRSFNPYARHAFRGGQYVGQALPPLPGFPGYDPTGGLGGGASPPSSTTSPGTFGTANPNQNLGPATGNITHPVSDTSSSSLVLAAVAGLAAVVLFLKFGRR